MVGTPTTKVKKSQQIRELEIQISNLTKQLHDHYEQSTRTIQYLRMRTEPIHILIDHGNYSQWFEILHPLDQVRLEEALIRLRETREKEKSSCART